MCKVVIETALHLMFGVVGFGLGFLFKLTIDMKKASRMNKPRG